jgi:uncharacterized damage-inducible protein DinB
MQTLADRFRAWFEHEKDCNRKIVAMLESVPEGRRGEPAYLKAREKATHILEAREVWLQRMGHYSEAPTEWDTPPAEVGDLPRRFAKMEAAWDGYLARLDEAELSRKFEYDFLTDARYRRDVEAVLTQLNGHAWYHRGQIATLVAGLGGKAVDTDYVYWRKGERVGPARSA